MITGMGPIPIEYRRVVLFCSIVFAAAEGVGEREYVGEGYGFNHPATADRHDGETQP